MMTLILIRAVKYTDIRVSNWEHDKRSMLGRLVKAMLDSKGLHRQGNYLGGDSENSIERMLKKNYGRKVSATYFELDGKDSESKIKDLVEKDYPLIVGISFTRKAELPIC